MRYPIETGTGLLWVTAVAAKVVQLRIAMESKHNEEPHGSQVWRENQLISEFQWLRTLPPASPFQGDLSPGEGLK
jgi:hypothetical protein